MSKPNPKDWRTWLPVIVAILGLFAITLVVSDDNGDGRPDRIEIKVNTAAGDGQPTKVLEVPTPAVDQAREELDHRDLDTAPPDAEPPSDNELERAAEVQADVKALPEAGAVQGFSGCATRILPANFSSRNGARATEQTLHYTVSPNRAGWSDVNAIVALFSNPARQASSNFVIDSEGNCAYIVPIEAKAWTQAGGNPWSVSYEIIATGSEPRYLEPAGMAKLKSVVHQVARRTGIPLRRGAVSSSCTPIRSGIVHHKDYGLCGGGHVDITPFSIDATVAALVAGDQVLTDRELKIVRSVRKPKGTGHSRRFWCGQLAAARRRIAEGDDHRRPARRRILRRVARAECA